jgi:hypothetical protein
MCGAQMIVEGLTNPNSLAVDAMNVYWADGDLGTVMQADLATGKSTQLAGGLSAPQSLVIQVPGASNPNYLYWVEPSAGNVDTEQVGGTADMQAATGQASPSVVAVPISGGPVFWFTANTNTDAGTVPGGLWGNNTNITSFYDGAGGKLAVWANSRNSFGIVFSTEAGGGTLWSVRAASLGGLMHTDPVSLVTGVSVAGVTLDSTFAYWTTGAAGSVAKVPLGGDGGAPIVIAPSEATPTDIAVDGLYAYWLAQGVTTGAGAVVKAPLASGAPIPLATGQVAPRGLFLTNNDVYWISGAKGQGAIKHLPK